MNKLVLKPGREKSLKRHHPWVFSGAVAKVTGKPESGETIEIHSSTGEFLAIAAYSPQSQIVARVWGWERREIDAEFFQLRIGRAVALRAHLLPANDTVRLVHAESDGLPGVVADRYGDTVVLQLSSAGAIRWRDAIADAIEAVVKPKTIFERSDADVLALEGIQPSVGLLRGAPPPEHVVIDEAGAKFEVDVSHGHKTGFYLDQRGNRLLLRGFANKREVLDCFAYTGGFTVNALIGGAAKVTAVDSSGPALELLKRNVALNKLPEPGMHRRRCISSAAQAARSGAQLRSDRARSAEIRADRGTRRKGRARLQGHQPARVQAAQGRADCCSRFRARAACRAICSRKSSPAPRSTPVSMRRSSNS